MDAQTADRSGGGKDPAGCPVPHDSAFGCPVDHHYSGLDAEFLTDPYAAFAAVREQPVFYAPQLGGYVVTRYRDVNTVMSNADQFSNSVVLTPLTPPSDEAREILEAVKLKRPPNLINADGERHSMVRRFVHEAMSPKRLRDMEPVIRDWARPKIEAMVELDEADFVENLAFPLPAFVGLSLMGVPAEDFEMVKAWSRDRLEFTYGRPAEEEQVEVASNVAAFWSYTQQFVRRRIEEPVDDLTSDLARHHLEGPEQFTELDVCTVFFEMVVAAHETTTFLLTNGMRRLLEQRDQWNALLEDPSLIQNAVEECMRFDGPAICWRRRATETVELGGVTIPAESTVLVLFGSANHDPEKFTDPETFDVRRPDARKHFGFGKGVHFCQGAPLARTEARVVLELMTQLAPDVTLVPGQEFEFVPNILMHGPSRLMLDFSGHTT